MSSGCSFDMLIAKAGELETKTESSLTMLKSGPIWSVLVVNRTRPRSSVAPVPTIMVAVMKLNDAKTSSQAPSINPWERVSTSAPWNTETASLPRSTRAHQASGGRVGTW